MTVIWDAGCRCIDSDCRLSLQVLPGARSLKTLDFTAVGMTAGQVVQLDAELPVLLDLEVLHLGSNTLQGKMATREDRARTHDGLQGVKS